MPGRRIGERAHHGPEEDRARKPSQDRAKKARYRSEAQHDTEGMTAKDASRWKRWQDKP